MMQYDINKTLACNPSVIENKQGIITVVINTYFAARGKHPS